MRNTILLFILISLFIGNLINCAVKGSEEMVNKPILAQKNDGNLQENKNKQRDKLYPYYLDLPVNLTLDGEVFNPILIAVDAFKKDSEIPKEKKNLSKYNLELRQDDDFFFVIMNVKRDPNKDYIGGETENGKDVTYFVSKKDNSVKRAFHK